MVDTEARYRGRDGDPRELPPGYKSAPRIGTDHLVTDGAEEPERPGLADIPRLVKTLVERAIDLGSARIQLAQAELKDEVRTRLRRAVFATFFYGLLLVGFALVNVGLVTWLAASIGLIGASFLLAGIYFALGIIGFIWFRSTGGFNPPEKEEDDND